ncbi:DUF4982 domain-containing protein [Flavisolibacter sp. BT320]|nr:DUF4982 domain-containing protein [Flavisolibacter longurius]
MHFVIEYLRTKDKVIQSICVLLFAFLFLLAHPAIAQGHSRLEISLDNDWYTRASDTLEAGDDSFAQTVFEKAEWKKVDVPHNWDGYDGYRRLRHGNRHGYAYYTKTFTLPQQSKGKRIFLFFEGVSSYATVWLNKKKVGYHAGGRTTFTIDITDEVLFNKVNNLDVRADHPANIQNLPWVCGGCSDERGFSEGSQPMGIFRPVHLVVTNEVRIEPFGVHIWNDSTATQKKAQVNVTTEVKNYSNTVRNVTVVSRLLDKKGTAISETRSRTSIPIGATRFVKQKSAFLQNVRLWSLEDPYLYTVVSEVIENGKRVDRITTPFGIRTIQWPIGRNNSNQFFLNGKPVFINGIAEYEHLLGNSHAFSAAQIRSRTAQMKAAGFNAFRDAHQPHNLRYQHHWDSLGMLLWTQISAHVWYDTKAFRENFKTLLREWVKERRNSPSVVMWGLQNESKLPEDFARECMAIIREMDPTASSQRLVTTCNGGSGTDWDVPQNWTGTYGGNPATYSDDLKRQVLIGEYGAWRTLDLHTEGPFVQNGAYSEDRMTQLMEMKLRLAEAAKDSAAGHFMWLFTSHDNPGRVQGGEGLRELDRIGPVNYKGLLTPWEEPLDVFYMFRSNYAPKETSPMVYIVSHTWPDRWTKPGKKDGIVVYSNCDEVELFNDVGTQSLGKRKRSGKGTHFQWDDADIQYNVLYAVGYVNGKAVAKDYIVLNHLPQAPHFNEFYKGAKNVLLPQAGYHYLYRVNCGGDEYRDTNGNRWLADRQRKAKDTWGSSSWTADFEGMHPFFASQRSFTDPIAGTKDWGLFQQFRYGRQKLRYDFPVQNGEYLVELYFTEPWVGRGGGLQATGWRLFDVAVNEQTVLKDVDIWKEAGYAGALKKSVNVKVTGGLLTVSFPRTASGQALISAIAIATLDKNKRAAPSEEALLKIHSIQSDGVEVKDWLRTGEGIYSDGERKIQALSSVLYGAQWIKAKRRADLTVSLTADADVFVAVDSAAKSPGWLQDFEDIREWVRLDDESALKVYRKRYGKGATLNLGGDGNKLVMAVPSTNMEPAYDLKPSNSYKAFNATIAGPGLKKGKVDGKDRVIFEKASADNKIEWTFSVGVADIYSLTVTYNNPTQQVMKGKLQLLAADGTLMKEEEIEFTPTRVGKSNYINATTGSMINAGNYLVRLSAEEVSGLTVNALDVQ